jgi:16S rRNA (guanine(966)-N(2))-methyltransferase RsmD
MFSMIQFDIEGRRVLDLFSGSGQLGIEALSRGAADAVFVDNSPAALSLTRENVAAAGFADRARVTRGDWSACLERAGRFGLIFLDPPFDAGLMAPVLEKIIKFDILTDNGIIICESRLHTPMPELPAPYTRRPDHEYGGIKLTIYSRTPRDGGAAPTEPPARKENAHI